MMRRAPFGDYSAAAEKQPISVFVMVRLMSQCKLITVAQYLVCARRQVVKEGTTWPVRVC